jgi:hypothetical protein
MPDRTADAALHVRHLFEVKAVVCSLPAFETRRH